MWPDFRAIFAANRENKCETNGGVALRRCAGLRERLISVHEKGSDWRHATSDSETDFRSTAAATTVCEPGAFQLADEFAPA